MWPVMNKAKKDELEGRIINGIYGLSIREADKALDSLRRLVWADAFTDADLSADNKVNYTPMLQLARELAKYPLGDSASVLESVRMAIWEITFPEAHPQLFEIPAPGQELH